MSPSLVANVLSLFAASADPAYRVYDEPRHPEAAAFLATWRELSRERDLVIGKDLPSRRLARFLGNVMIVEPIDNEADCHVRLAGTMIRRRYGREVTGESLSGLLSPAMFAHNQARMRKVRETGQPLIQAADIAQNDAPPLCFEAVILRALAPDEQAMWNVAGLFMFDS